MNYDLGLISAVLESRDITSAITAGADTPNLLEDEAQIYWDVLKDQYDSFHEVPSIEHFKTLCPTYEHVKPSDSVESIVHELKTMRLGAEIEKAIHDLAGVNRVDPWDARTRLMKATEKIVARNSTGNTDHTVGHNLDALFHKIERLQSGQGLIGYPWPWDMFNSQTTGLCPGNCIYIYGRQKSRKTFLLLYLALHYWSLGLKVLFFTREMTHDELMWRILALLGDLDYLSTLRADISTEAKKNLREQLQAIADSDRFIITDIGEGTSAFKAKIEEHRPQVVFHDYFKAMADDMMGDKTGSEHRYVARAVDQMVNYVSTKAKIPLFFAGHANREGAKSRGTSSTEHAWSDHITRRVDMAMRVVTDRRNDRMALIVNAGRSIREGIGITLDANLCTGFGEVIDEDYSWVKNFVEQEEEEQKSKARTNSTPSGTPTNSKFSPGSFKKSFRR
tara:strand:+ start:238 stop:1584 length:1347 start_codon:yes stop_codon:yes gene_type:complete